LASGIIDPQRADAEQSRAEAGRESLDMPATPARLWQVSNNP
jgi:hypothetical protein